MGYIVATVALVVVGVCRPEMDAIDHVVRKPNRLMVRMIVRTVLLGRGERIRPRHRFASRPDYRIERRRMARFDPILREEFAIDLDHNAMLTPLGRNFRTA